MSPLVSTPLKVSLVDYLDNIRSEVGKRRRGSMRSLCPGSDSLLLTSREGSRNNDTCRMIISRSALGLTECRILSWPNLALAN